MARFSEIPPDALMRRLGTPDAPFLIDVTLDDDFNADPYLIPTALRCPHREVTTLLPEINGRPVVVTCKKGGKLSHGAAALLRAHDVRAEALAGGNYAWRDAALPRLPAALVPPRGQLWVSRARPKIDRIACPWLIRRFIDPTARFLFTPASDVLLVAEYFDAIAFDTEGGTWGHQGDLCTFDMLLQSFALTADPLLCLATVIRAADTDRHDLAPQAAGLLALSVGLSRMYKDDLAQLEAGMGLYDALYRWARDGQDEGHTA